MTDQMSMLLKKVERYVSSRGPEALELRLHRNSDGTWIAEAGHSNSGGDFWLATRLPGAEEPRGTGSTLKEALVNLLLTLEWAA